jgi:DNA ligase-1
VTQLAELADASAAVARLSGRLAKVEALATTLRGRDPDAAELAASWLAGEVRQAKLGIGPALLRQALATPFAPRPTLGVPEVDRILTDIASGSGAGALARRTAALASLFGRATAEEQRFLARLISGELRQGAQAGLMVEAIARATGTDVGRVRRAAMLGGGLRFAAAAAFREGEAGLARFRLRVLEPVLPMLAQTAETVDAAIAAHGEAVFDWKVDGARVQIHRDGATVRCFTRNLNDVADALPEVVEQVGAFAPSRLVLDAEVVALRPDGTPQPFQVTMQRVGRKRDVTDARARVPVTFFVFDCLLVDDDDDLLLAPLAERLAALDRAVPAPLRMPRITTRDAGEAARFLADALERGHEGVMAKSLEAPWEAGHRGGGWLKIKAAHTLDLVVLAAEWGHGRRSGFLSNLHLGARDPETGDFVMLGKTFKGLTDATLAWQTEALLARETHRDRHTVHVRPELVVEIAFNNVQSSSQYPGGLALRFARLKGYRPDKSPTEADTIETVRALHAREHAP